MYTLKNLQQKNLKELKEISRQLNVAPGGDRRCRQNWINVLIGTLPPLLQLLEVSPGVEPVQATKPLMKRLEPAECDKLTFIELLELCRDTDKHLADKSLEQLQNLRSKVVDCTCRPGGLSSGNQRHRAFWIREIRRELTYLLRTRSLMQTPRGLGRHGGEIWQKPIIEDFEALVLRFSPETEHLAVIEVQAQEPIESKFGRIVYPKPTAKPIAQTEKITPGETDGNATESDRLANLRAHSHCPGTNTAELHGSSSGIEGSNPQHEESDRVLAAAGKGQRDSRGALLSQPIELAVALDDERPPNRGDGKSRIEQVAKTSTAHQLLELFKSKADIVEDSPGVKTELRLGQSAITHNPVTNLDNLPGVKIEPKQTQSVIASTAENLPRPEADPNPILTGITLSDSFLSRYSPPQSEIVHFQADADDQLSLLDFTVETSDEPPDPDDFASIDAFNESIARWDAENAEALAVYMDSMCEWAPCPDDWYEPEAGIMPLKAPSRIEVMEVGPTSSDHTSDHLPGSSDRYEVRKCWNFSIPTFDAWRDRPKRQTDSDEPPDTGNYARLPGPKPPKFPPRAIGQVSLSQGKSASRNYPETIPKLSHYMAAAGSSRLGRSPPGGDVM